MAGAETRSMHRFQVNTAVLVQHGCSFQLFAQGQFLVLVIVPSSCLQSGTRVHGTLSSRSICFMGAGVQLVNLVNIGPNGENRLRGRGEQSQATYSGVHTFTLDWNQESGVHSRAIFISMGWGTRHHVPQRDVGNLLKHRHTVASSFKANVER